MTATTRMVCRPLAQVGFAAILSIGCQDVQPGSTLAPPIAETDMDGAAAADTEEQTGLDVLLEVVDQPRPDIALAARNPFRYGGGPVGGSDIRMPQPQGSGAPEAVEARPAPVAPRIRLRMIGLVEAADAAGPIAVLTDGEVVLYGREGEILEGRYRIVGVSPTSVEIETIYDGGRQVLRLAGS